MENFNISILENTNKDIQRKRKRTQKRNKIKDLTQKTKQYLSMFRCIAFAAL